MAADAELGNASVDIDVLLAPLRRKLGDARGLVQDEMTKAGDAGGRSLGSRIASSLKAGLASVAKVAAVTAAAGVVALGGIAVAGAKAGLATASAMEQAQVSFTTMLGSAKKADAFLGKLGAFAAKTPFEFPELQTAASSLVSAGINANKVIPIMTSLGNATAGMGTGSEGIKRATVALQQMSAAGKITGEDLNQLRDAGVPVFDLLSAATGKSVKQVAELANKGKLGAKELGQLMSALESGKGLERFNGLMDKQSQTLTGQLSTLKDTINMGLANAVKPWLPTIKAGLGKVSEAAGPFFTWLAAKSAEMAKHGPAMLAKVSAAVAKAKPIFESIRGAVTGFIAGLQGKGPIAGFSGALNTAGLGLRALVLAFKEGDVTSDGFVGKMETIGVALKTVKDSVAGVLSGLGSGDFSSAGDSMGSLADSAAKLGPFLAQLVASLPSFNDILSVTATVVGFAADHVDTLAKIMPALVAAYAAVKVAQAAGNVAAAASVPLRVLELLQKRQLTASNNALAASNRLLAGTQVQATTAENVGILTRIRAGVATVAKTVAEKAAAVATKAYAATQWLLNAAMSANPIGLVIVALAALVAGIVLAWQHSETFRTVVLAAWAAVQAGIGVAVAWLEAAVPAVFAGIKAAVLRYTPLGVVLSHWGQIRAGIAAAVASVRATINWFAGLPGKFRSWFSSAAQAATGKLGDLVSWVKGLPGRIVDAIGDVGDLLTDKGADIVSGLIQGIRNMGGRLAGFVKQFVKDHIPGPVAKALGIASPSKVAAEQGRWYPLGLAKGMLSKAHAVRSASMELAAAAVRPMTLSPAGVALAGGVPSSMMSPATRVAASSPAATQQPAAAGPVVNVYPRAHQSEEEIAEGVARKVARKVRL